MLYSLPQKVQEAQARFIFVLLVAAFVYSPVKSFATKRTHFDETNA
jgi:hypothetical protein